jgi:hypothetical protein
MATTATKFDLTSLIWPLAIWTITWGLYPQPPRVIRELGRNEIFQYFLIFVLIWSLAGRSIPLAAITTLIVFVATKLLDGNLGLCNNNAPQQNILPQQFIPPPQQNISPQQQYIAT